MERFVRKQTPEVLGIASRCIERVVFGDDPLTEAQRDALMAAGAAIQTVADDLGHPLRDDDEEGP